MTYRIEVAEFETRTWVAVGLVEQTLAQLRMYLSVVKHMYPGSHVRACDLKNGMTVLEV